MCSQRSGMLDALERRIKEGDAAWAVELRCRETLMCRVETSRDARQEVVWDGRDIAGDVLVTPGVLAVREFPLRREAGTLSGEPKRAMPRTVPAGLWLARGKSGRAKPLAGHLLAFRRAPELERGGIAVAPDRTNGYLRFTVRLAPDVFRHAGSDPSLRTAALVAVCSRFPQAFGRWGPENGEPALARELRSLVAARGNGVALWDEEDYDPARMATALEPLRLPDRSPFPLADGVLLARTRPVFDRWQKDMIFEVALHGQWEAADPQVKALVRRRQQELRSAVDGGYRALGSYLRRKLQIGRYETIGAPPFPRAELAPPNSCSCPPSWRRSWPRRGWGRWGPVWRRSPCSGRCATSSGWKRGGSGSRASVCTRPSCSAAEAAADPGSVKPATSFAERADFTLPAVPGPSFPIARWPVRGGGTVWPKRSSVRAAGGRHEPPPAMCSVPTTRLGSSWRPRRCGQGPGTAPASISLASGQRS